MIVTVCKRLSDRAPQHPLTQGAEQDARTLVSSTLLQGGKTVNIVHNGSIYRLQATRMGKLILTK